MGLNIQIVIDSSNPHELADWWAETLEWAVEPQDEAFIRSMIDQGYATEEETLVHHGKLVWSTGAAIRPAEELDAKAPAHRLLFQTVPESKDGEEPDPLGCADRGPGQGRGPPPARGPGCHVPLDRQPGAAFLAHHGGP